MGFLGNGFMSGIGRGLSQGSDNAMRLFMFYKQQQQEAAKLQQEKDWRLQQGTVQNAVLKIQQDEERRKAEEAAGYTANRQGMMGAIGNSITPGGEYVAQGEDPTTGDMQSQGIPYAAKMDYEKALTGAVPYLDQKTAPLFNALMQIRKLPLEEQKAALAQLVQMSQITRNKAQEEKARREPIAKQAIKTIYNIKDPSKTKLVTGGDNYTPPEGWTLNEPSKEPKVRNQQGFFVNEKGQPMVFDPIDGSYKVAPVEGGGTVNARPAAPYFTPVQTTEGVLPFDARKGNFPAPSPGNIPAPSKPLPAGAMREFGDLSSLKQQVQRAADLYNPEYVGPVMGRLYSTGESWVNLPKDQVKFYSYVNDTKDALLRARSGAQINEQEYARLVKFLPTAELPPDNFKARMERFQEQIDLIMSEKASVYSGQGYKVDAGTPGAKGKTVVERRTSPTGKKLVKYSDGTIGEE